MKHIVTGRARYVDDGTIEMLDSSQLHQLVLAKVAAAIAPAEKPMQPRQSPQIGKLVEFIPDTFTGQTFMRYPQPDSFRKAA